MRKTILLLALFCAACSNYSSNLPSIRPYKMDINQGNVVTSKMMMQLRPGMSKAQVKFIMGTPLIVDAFHANRWDYFYQKRKDGKIIEQRRVIMEFENDKLARVRGDVIPAGGEGTQGAAGEQPANKAPVTLKSAPGEGAPKPKEKGWMDKLKFWGDDEEAKPAGTAAQPAAQPEQAPAPAPVRPAQTEPASPAAQPEAPAAAEPATVEAPAQPAAAQARPEHPAVEAKPAEAAPVAKPEPKAAAAQPGIRLQQDAPKPLPKAAAEPAAEAAQPVAKPEPVIKPEARPEAKAEPQPEAKPRGRTRAPSSEPKPIPKPSDDLPPEESPDYFERMLEKIGF